MASHGSDSIGATFPACMRRAGRCSARIGNRLGGTCIASPGAGWHRTPSLALWALIRTNALASQSPERKRVGSIGTLNTHARRRAGSRNEGTGSGREGPGEAWQK